MSIRVSSQALKQRLLENAWPLVDQYIAAAIGKGELQSTNVDARTEVWDVLKQLMLASSDKIDIDIKSAQDVIDAVTDGRCTLEEGDKLIKLYESAKKIETGGVGIEAHQGSGLTINILNADLAAEDKPKVIEHDE